MKFLAEKGNKKRLVMTEGCYLILKRVYKNPTQAELAAKRLKDSYRKQGWKIAHLVHAEKKEEEKPLEPPKEKRKRRVTKVFGYNAIVEEE